MNPHKVFEVGDRVYTQIGAPIGLVIETTIEQVLVEYYWGKAYWYYPNQLHRTCLPVNRG